MTKEFQCINCGKRFPREITGGYIIMFCSKDCKKEYVSKQLEKEDFDDGLVWPKLRAEDISNEAYLSLVGAIVENAKKDVVTLAESAYARQDAERFFLSPYFESLTGLDGWEVLDKLLDDADAYQRKKRERLDRQKKRMGYSV